MHRVERSGSQKFAKRLGLGNVTLRIRSVRPLRVRELGGRQEAPPPQLLDDGDRRPRDRQVAQLLRVPVAPQERVEVPGCEAVDRRGQLALEREPAHLAVGHDLEAGLLLQREGPVDRPVLGTSELLGGDLPGRVESLRLEQLRRTQQAADDVRARLDQRAPRPAPRPEPRWAARALRAMALLPARPDPRTSSAAGSESSRRVRPATRSATSSRPSSGTARARGGSRSRSARAAPGRGERRARA